jgi:dienelactone hydrolase
MADFYVLQEEYRRQAQAGDLTKALETARRLWDAFPDRRNFTWMFLASANAAMGNLDRVAQVLRQALDANALWRLSLLEIPELELVRSDPGCQAVIDEARRRIVAKHYRPLVIVERPPHDGISPLLLHLHGANGDAAGELPHWHGAAGLGWIVAAGQSSQPSAEDRFCWDPPPQRTWQDLRTIASMLPAHARVVLSGFSQGAWVALQAALRSDIFQPAGVIMVAPFLAGRERLETSGRRLRIAMILGDEDPLIEHPEQVIDALAARGHHVEVIRLANLGHAYPGDFAERLPGLLESVTRRI